MQQQSQVLAHQRRYIRELLPRLAVGRALLYQTLSGEVNPIDILNQHWSSQLRETFLHVPRNVELVFILFVLSPLTPIYFFPKTRHDELLVFLISSRGRSQGWLIAIVCTVDLGREQLSFVLPELPHESGIGFDVPPLLLGKGHGLGHTPLELFHQEGYDNGGGPGHPSETMHIDISPLQALSKEREGLSKIPRDVLGVAVVQLEHFVGDGAGVRHFQAGGRRQHRLDILRIDAFFVHSSGVVSQPQSTCFKTTLT